MNDFEAFWRIYPTRRPHPHPKQPARTAWERAVRAGGDPGQIVAGAKAYASYAALEAIDPRYICHAATWLNQHRWEQYTETDPAEIVAQMDRYDTAKRDREDLLPRLAAYIKRRDRPCFIFDKDIAEMLAKALITPAEAAAVGYSASLRVIK